MGETPHAQLVQAFRRAASVDLREFTVLHDRELTVEMITGLQDVGFPDSLGVRLQKEAGQQACDVLRNALKLIDSQDTAVLSDLSADFAAIYLNHHYGASPVESPWVDDNGLVRQEAMFQVREFYKKHHLFASEWHVRTEDHLVLELQFLTHLFELDDEQTSLAEAAQFLDEHLLRWIGEFANRITSRCDTAFYAGLNLLTAAYLDELRDLLADILQTPRPTPEEIEQRMKPKANPKVEEVPLQYMPGVAESW